MSKIFAFATLVLAAVSSVSGLVIPRQPPNWATGYLENYDTYHARYVALKCEDQHGQQFFNDCCHPLLATETLANNRKPECTPGSSAYSSAMAAEPTSVVDSSDDYEDCDGEGDEPSSSPVSTLHSTPASSPHTTPSPSPHTTPSPSPYTPETTTTHTSHTPSPSPSPSPSSSSGGSSGSSGLITGGVATFFYQNGVAGACGTVHSDSALIAAMDQARYGNSGGASSLCGKQVKITNTENNKSVVVTVADDCPTCLNENSIDLSVGAFTQIATEAQGEVTIEWEFV